MSSHLAESKCARIRGRSVPQQGLLVAAVLLVAIPAAAQPGDRVVTAEAPIVNGNAVLAKQRALADAFRQVAESAFADLLKETGSEAQPLPGGLLQVKASLAGRGQRFVRSYRILQEEESNGRLRVQIDADVDTALLRREMERARGTTAAPMGAAPARTAGLAILVGGDVPDEARAMVLKLLGTTGVRVQSLSVRDEAALVAAATRQSAQALWLAGTSFAEGPIRGTARFSVRCQLHARLSSAGLGGRGGVLGRDVTERGFADDEAGARLACLQRAAGALAGQISESVRPLSAASGYVTLDLDVVEPGALMTVVQVLKRLGAVTAAEVRRVTTQQAEIRVFTRMTGREIEAALIRDIGGRLTLTEMKPPTDRITLQARLLGEPPPGAGAEPPASKP
jgi:hypothetical protein